MPVRNAVPDVSIPEDTTLPGLILARAESFADRTALIDGLTGKELTYGQFSTLIRSTAASMHQRGLRKGDVVFLVSPNCVEFLVVYMAATSIGAIMSAVNPLSTEEELVYYLNDSKPAWLVVHVAMVEKALQAADTYGGMKERFVIGAHEGITQVDELFHGDPNEVPSVDINPREDLSALLYSSGTVGRPKGVMLTHYAQLANIFQLGCEKFMVFVGAPHQTTVSILPFFHSSGIAVSFELMYNGHAGILFPRFLLEQYLKAIQDHKVRTIIVVPPIVVVLAKHPLVSNYKLDSLKYIIVGAAPLSQALELECKQRLQLNTVRQIYGMTENGPLTHFMPQDIQKEGSIGLPLPNVQCKVVDNESGRELAMNEDGELWIKGPGTMKGYLNLAEATADFITADGYCKTGDIGHYDEDGHFFIVDRLKELIKYKGFQVAPADLEGLLLTHPDVADSAVIGVPDEAAGELPRAYVARKKDATVTESELVAFVAGHVAPHKHLRGGVVFLDAIPKSASGKILRRVLRDQAKEELNKSS